MNFLSMSKTLEALDFTDCLSFDSLYLSLCYQYCDLSSDYFKSVELNRH